MTSDTNSRGTREQGDGGTKRSSCRLCSGALVFALSARDRVGVESLRFDYFECVECGALQLEPIPADLEAAYGRDYYTARQRVAPGRRDASRGLRHGLARLRLRLGSGSLGRLLSGRRYGRFEWFRRTGTRQGDAILDVGCGSGRLLFRLHADGFRELVGIDPNLPPETETYAAGRSGLRFERSTPQAHRGAYPLVMAHHSFEHMRDPAAAFAAMAALVAPGGWLLLRVPLADAWARSHYGPDWAQLDAPRHLQIPTRRSIACLAAGAGLELVHSEDDSGVFQIWGSERSHPRNRVLRFGHWLAARKRAARLRRAGMGDQAAFYLRRIT